MDKLTEEQKIALTGFTKSMLVDNFSTFHGDVERRIARAVYTHEFASEEFWANVVKPLYENEVKEMCGIK